MGRTRTVFLMMTRPLSYVRVQHGSHVRSMPRICVDRGLGGNIRLGGWVDGWVGGWVGGCFGRWVNEWVGKWVGGWVDVGRVPTGGVPGCQLGV